jgi:hypothetical protein
MEYFSPHPRLARKDNGRRDRVGRDTESRIPSAQETKDGTNKDKEDR